MRPYGPSLKPLARRLRTGMTDAEQWLWQNVRRKQMLGVQFYRQKPIGSYIVDFYAPNAKLVVEVDGGQHLESGQLGRDKRRDDHLRSLGLEVMRFDNLQVLTQGRAVLESIYAYIEGSRSYEPAKSPPTPFDKGGFE